MKTAMQEIIQWIVDKQFPVNKEFVEKTIEFTMKEKEQIENAYWASYKEGQYSGDRTAEEYYNETFNQEPKKEYGPSEKYLAKQRELMEDFIWNKMNKL